jgi:DNA-binding NtrC family response regulator
LGSSRLIPLRARFIFTTHRNLEELVAQGTFREDLYYRLNVVPIDIAPLRERREDIPDLANLFISRFTGESGKPVEGITPDAMQILVNYHWPGNVRELQNIVERACALAKGSVLDSGDIYLDVRPAKAANGGGGFLPEGMTLEQWEDEMVQEALRRANGNKSQAARLLGLSRNALRYRLSKIGISDEGEKES